jgi:hypothetical protein
VGLSPEEIFLPSSRLLGEPVTFYDNDSSQAEIAVLGCGDVGCWPFWGKIKLREDVVIWDDFEQPRRRVWRYDEMRPFVFDRAQYLSALDRGLD